MYKVFFKDRFVTLGEVLQDHTREKDQLKHRYKGRSELKEAVDQFASMEELKQLHIYHSNLPGLQEAFRSCFTCINAGGGVLVNHEGEFLAIKRNGVWDLPKGKLETGEDFETAALREVEEETGLTGIKLVQPVISTYHTYELPGQQVLKRTQWFRMFYPGNRPTRIQKSEGITESRWVLPGETAFISLNTYGTILDVLTTCGLL